jgi:hypothetical protein
VRRTGTERVTPQWLRSAGRHRSKYTPTTGAWVPRALDVRTESHSCCWECSASTSRPARPSAGSAGSKWRPIASLPTSPKNIRVLAGSTCRRRSCGRTQPSKSDRRSRRRHTVSRRIAPRAVRPGRLGDIGKRPLRVKQLQYQDPLHSRTTNVWRQSKDDDLWQSLRAPVKSER